MVERVKMIELDNYFVVFALIVPFFLIFKGVELQCEMKFIIWMSINLIQVILKCVKFSWCIF